MGSILIICCVCVITTLTLQTVTSQTSGSSNSNVTRTGSLAVNCTFNITGTSFVNLISLSIVLAENASSPQEQLASTNAFTPDAIAANVLNATVSGHIDQADVSYLNLQWESTIQANDTRLLLCAAHGLTRLGQLVDDVFQPQVELDQPEATPSSVNNTDQQKQITSLQNKVDALKASVDSKLGKQQVQIDNLTLGVDALKNLTSAIDTLANRLDELENNCSRLLCQNMTARDAGCPMNVTTRAIQAQDCTCTAASSSTRTSEFIESAEYEGKHYLLSNKSLVEDNLAEIACINEGGYLAEIGDVQEYEFIKDFINSSLSDSFTMILIGATESKNQWNHRYSKQLVTFTNWAPNEPNSSHGCMFLFYHRNAHEINMVDLQCYVKDPAITFLCEVA